MATNRYAEGSRQILDQWRIHIDDAVNGKWLARSAANAGRRATHGSTHSKEFLEHTYRLLRKCRSEDEVRYALDYIKRQLDNGKWPPSSDLLRP